MLHDDLHLPGLEILHQGIQLSSLHSQKFHDFLLLSEGELDVELFVGGVDAVELDCLDLLDAEVEDRLWNEDQRLLEHVQPACLRLHVCLNAGLSRFGFEVVAGLDEVESCSGVDELDKDLELRTRVLRFQLLEVGIVVLRLRTDLGLDVNLNLLLDLDDDVAIDRLALVDGLVLVELQYNGNL